MSTTGPEVEARGSRLAMVGTIILAVLAFVTYLLNIALVPVAKKKFDESGTQLPSSTLEIIRVSNWIAEYWWQALAVCVVFAIANYAIVRWLNRFGTLPAFTWIATTALALTALMTFTLVSIVLSLMKIREGVAD